MSPSNPGDPYLMLQFRRPPLVLTAFGGAGALVVGLALWAMQPRVGDGARSPEPGRADAAVTPIAAVSPAGPLLARPAAGELGGALNLKRTEIAVITEDLALRMSALAVPPEYRPYSREVADVRRWFEAAVAYAFAQAVRYRLGVASAEREMVSLLILPELGAVAQSRLEAIPPPPLAAANHRGLIQAIGAYASALADARPSELRWTYRSSQEGFRLHSAGRLGAAAAQYRRVADVPDELLSDLDADLEPNATVPSR